MSAPRTPPQGHAWEWSEDDGCDRCPYCGAARAWLGPRYYRYHEAYRGEAGTLPLPTVAGGWRLSPPPCTPLGA